MGSVDEQTRGEQARQVGLFRYRIVQDVVDARLSGRQRAEVIRGLVAVEHDGPFGARVRLSRPTIERWCRWWRAGGFEALVPRPARVAPRTPVEVLDLAAALKREAPARTAVQVTRILTATSGWSPSERTLQRHFARLGLCAPEPGGREVFGRFEAARPNEIWTGDALCRVRHKASYADRRIMPIGCEAPGVAAGGWGLVSPVRAA